MATNKQPEQKQLFSLPSNVERLSYAHKAGASLNRCSFLIVCVMIWWSILGEDLFLANHMGRIMQKSFWDLFKKPHFGCGTAF